MHERGWRCTDEEDINELDGFLAAYAGEPDGDLVNRIENDDLLTWGILRRLLSTVRATLTEDARSRVKVLEDALEAIRYEAERENGSWVHLKRCIATQARTALGNKETDRHG